MKYGNIEIKKSNTDYKVNILDNNAFINALDLNFKYIRKNSPLELFCDYETGVYNLTEAKTKPTLAKTYVLTFQVAFIKHNGDVITSIFNNFMDFMTLLTRPNKNLKINLNFHNGNKFDNHYLLRELLDYGFELANMLLAKQRLVLDKKEVKTDIKDLDENTVYTSYVRSGTNVGLTFRLDNITFTTVDTVQKKPMALSAIADILVREKYLLPSHTKTEFNYNKFKHNENYTIDEITHLTTELFNNLTPDELEYCYNDVIILARFYYWFTKTQETNIIKWSNISQTSNTFKVATDDDIPKFILAREVNKFIHDDLNELKTSNYNIKGANLNSFIRRSYKGGYTDFNDKYLGKEVNNMFSIDINSSYPYVMYSQYLPTIFREVRYKVRLKAFNISQVQEHYMFLEVDNEWLMSVINKAKGHIRQTFLKHYVSKFSSTTVLDSVKVLTLMEHNLLKDNDIIEISRLVVFDSEKGVLSNFINKYYSIKQGGKAKTILDFSRGMCDIRDTGERNENILPTVEIDNAKVHLNAMYGATVMKPAFDMFMFNDNGELTRFENELINNERNAAYGAGITSWAFHNLLYPLTSLTHDQIDDVFVYCDTDSLYLKQYTTDFNNNVIDVKTQLQQVIKFNPNNLGDWDVENDNITKFYIFNNKQYVYIATDKDGEHTTFKCAGLPKNVQKEQASKINSSNFTIKIKELMTIDFKTNRSIKTTMGTIAIVDSSLKLQKALTKQQRELLNTNSLLFKLQAANALDNYNNMLDEEEHDGLEKTHFKIGDWSGSLQDLRDIINNDFDLDKTYNNDLQDNSPTLARLLKEAYSKITSLTQNTIKISNYNIDTFIIKYIGSISQIEKINNKYGVKIKFKPNSEFHKNMKGVMNNENYDRDLMNNLKKHIFSKYSLREIKNLTLGALKEILSINTDDKDKDDHLIKELIKMA